jgi:hypothetical protein
MNVFPIFVDILAPFVDSFIMSDIPFRDGVIVHLTTELLNVIDKKLHVTKRHILMVSILSEMSLNLPFCCKIIPLCLDCINHVSTLEAVEEISVRVKLLF